MDLTYEIISIKNKDLFENEIDLSPLDCSFTNIYVTGINTICKIESIREFPIKNRKIAIKQILSFIKFVENTFWINNIKSDTIEIQQEEIIKMFNRNTYVDFLKLLNELNIFKAVPYSDGSYYNCGKLNNSKIKTKRYKLTDEYKNDELCLIIINDKKDIIYDIDGKYNKKFTKAIIETTIDIKSAILDEIKYEKSHNSLRSRLNTIFNLYEKRYIKKGFNVDRVFHSLTNISKVSRKHLSVKGLKFNNIDIVNCQPLLLCYYLIKNNLKIDSKYINDCELGKLYERFIIEGTQYKDKEYIIKNNKIVATKINTIDIGYNLTEEEYKIIRDKIKVLLYKSIFFDFKPETDIAKKFNEIYPEVYSTLNKLETTDLKMAARLQNIEAELFNDLIPNKSKYFFTLFDAIYFTSLEDTGDIILELSKKFHKMGLVPQYKINE